MRMKLVWTTLTMLALTGVNFAYSTSQQQEESSDDEAGAAVADESAFGLDAYRLPIQHPCAYEAVDLIVEGTPTYFLQPRVGEDPSMPRAAFEHRDIAEFARRGMKISRWRIAVDDSVGGSDVLEVVDPTSDYYEREGGNPLPNGERFRLYLDDAEDSLWGGHTLVWFESADEPAVTPIPGPCEAGATEDAEVAVDEPTP